MDMASVRAIFHCSPADSLLEDLPAASSMPFLFSDLYLNVNRSHALAMNASGMARAI